MSTFIDLPKSDLHCHLDGSLRPETIFDIAKQENIDLPANNIAHLKKLLVCGEKVSSLPQFLTAFDITCSVLQSFEAIKRAMFELCEDAHNENVKILEVRYCPALSTLKGLSQEKVIEAMYEGGKQANEKYGITFGLIMSALRIDPVSVTSDLARLAVDLKELNIVAFDLCHAENGNPAKNHAKTFDIAVSGGLNSTVHAGEDAGPESIWEAINYCHATRIGHGRTLIEDQKLVQHVIDKNIVVEACPSSNVQIDLIDEMKNHPIEALRKAGVRITLNTDNRLLTGIRVTDEYQRMADTFDWSLDTLSNIAQEGLNASFCKAVI